MIKEIEITEITRTYVIQVFGGEERHIICVAGIGVVDPGPPGASFKLTGIGQDNVIYTDFSKKIKKIR